MKPSFKIGKIINYKVDNYENKIDPSGHEMTKEVQRSKYIHLINENSLPDYKGKKFLTDQEKDLFEKRFVE